MTELGGRTVLVAGASGLIGRALGARLTAEGARVLRLVRRARVSPDEIAWDPRSGRLEAGEIEGVDAVVNLAGENIAGGRWTAVRRAALRSSRVEATRTLVGAVSQLKQVPRVWLNASAVGYYGARGEAVVTEADALGAGFLAELCQAWETQAAPVRQLGVRVAWLRFGVVLTPDGGALAKLLPLFRLGLGGRVGDGRQWMSWISRPDAVGAIRHALVSPACAGPINLVAPTPVTNAEFTAVLARVLRRPACLPVPAGLLRLAFGEMADETLLASTRAVPARLRETGYRFLHPDLAAALTAALAPGGTHED